MITPEALTMPSNTGQETAEAYHAPLVLPLGDIVLDTRGARQAGVYDVYNGYHLDVTPVQRATERAANYASPILRPLGEVATETLGPSPRGIKDAIGDHWF